MSKKIKNRKIKKCYFDLTKDIDFKTFLVALEADSKYGISFEVFLFRNNIRYSDFERILKKDKKKRKAFKRVLKDVEFNLRAQGHEELGNIVKNQLIRNAELKKDALRIYNKVDFGNDGGDYEHNKRIKYSLTVESAVQDKSDEEMFNEAMEGLKKARK